MTDDWDDDDGLLGALAEALAEEGEVPSRIRDFGRELFAWRTVDAELAEVADEAASATTAVREGEPTWQSLSFRAATLSIELDVDHGAGTVRGQVVTHTGAPPREVVVEGPGLDPIKVPVDEVGYFRAQFGAPLARFRLRVGSVVTPFVD